MIVQLSAIGTVSAPLNRDGTRKAAVAMFRSAPLSSDRADEQVEDMILLGTTFARVEDVIGAAQLSDHHKGALWLLAWSLRDPAIQRRDARLMAEASAPDGRDLCEQGAGRDDVSDPAVMTPQAASVEPFACHGRPRGQHPGGGCTLRRRTF